MSDPRQREAHELPLSRRLVDEVIRTWLDTATGLAKAGFGDLTEYDRGARAAIEQMRYLHLDAYWYTVTPKILDELKRAGLRATPEEV